MAEFPRTENDVIALCEAMVAGYTAHPGDFPSITPEALAELAGDLASYKTEKDEYGDAKSQIRLKTVCKAEDFESLMETMKSFLKKSEADCTALPEKLYEIGWGPRATPVPTQPPYPPGLLKIMAEGQGDIWFEWEIVARSPLNNWIIERRQQLTPGVEFGPWTIAGTSVNTEAHLSDQPRGVQLEYRVKGVNSAGEGEPSNTVAAVL